MFVHIFIRNDLQTFGPSLLILEVAVALKSYRLPPPPPPSQIPQCHPNPKLTNVKVMVSAEMLPGTRTVCVPAGFLCPVL
jgi:hypothetical protein